MLTVQERLRRGRGSRGSAGSHLGISVEACQRSVVGPGSPGAAHRAVLSFWPRCSLLFFRAFAMTAPNLATQGFRSLPSFCAPTCFVFLCVYFKSVHFPRRNSTFQNAPLGEAVSRTLLGHLQKASADQMPILVQSVSQYRAVPPAVMERCRSL